MRGCITGIRKNREPANFMLKSNRKLGLLHMRTVERVFCPVKLVVAALLLAPQTGRESRERLRGYARRAEGDLRDLAGRAGEVLEEVVGEGKEFVDSNKAVLREAFDAGREAMRRERDRLREEDRG